MVGLWIGLGVAALCCVGLATLYNRLVGLRNRVRNGFSQIDVQLKRRYDLIPNLVETARGYMEHEKELLTKVAEARAQAANARTQAALAPGMVASMGGLLMAEGMLSGALGRFFGVVENYPELKADKTMSDLMENLVTTENRVAFARQAYNDAVMQYNTARERVPDTFVARAGGFAEAAYFQVDDAAEREAVAVVLGDQEGLEL